MSIQTRVFLRGESPATDTASLPTCVATRYCPCMGHYYRFKRGDPVTIVSGRCKGHQSAIMASSPAYPGIEYPLATQEGVAIGVADGYATARSLPSFVNLHIETDLANGINLLHHAKDGGKPLVLTSATRTFAS